MVTEHFNFNFGSFKTSAHIMPKLPAMEDVARDFGGGFFKPLLICDNNTEYLAVQLCKGFDDAPICTLKAGESRKNWQAVETVLRKAHEAGLGRDGIFIGVGGGIVSDLSAFAASIYMRGCSLVLVTTTLLGMVDAGLVGKTGFDLFGCKNIAGTFYPARHVYMPMESLMGLPIPEWKSGMAELIKTAILDGAQADSGYFIEISDIMHAVLSGENVSMKETVPLARCISRALRFKGGIVEEDPLETGNRRILLNLGHTFGHALESVAGLGTISHGEAVAWGVARSCDLGLSLGICPEWRSDQIKALLAACGYEIAARHPLMGNGALSDFLPALGSDKKKRGGNIMFIVPDEKSARPVPVDDASLVNTISNIICQ
jgi:3-dehydroquinate synthase